MVIHWKYTVYYEAVTSHPPTQLNNPLRSNRSIVDDLLLKITPPVILSAIETVYIIRAFVAGIDGVGGTRGGALGRSVCVSVWFPRTYLWLAYDFFIATYYLRVFRILCRTTLIPYLFQSPTSWPKWFTENQRRTKEYCEVALEAWRVRNAPGITRWSIPYSDLTAWSRNREHSVLRVLNLPFSKPSAVSFGISTNIHNENIILSSCYYWSLI